MTDRTDNADMPAVPAPAQDHAGSSPPVEQEAAEPAARIPGVFQLEHAIRIADKVALAAGTTIHVRKPMGGALRGANLGGLVRMEYDQVALVAPRVTTPALQPPMIANMDPADIMMLAGELVDFLLPTAAKAALFPSA